jgi:hypothetical protein
VPFLGLGASRARLLPAYMQGYFTAGCMQGSSFCLMGACRAVIDVLWAALYYQPGSQYERAEACLCSPAIGSCSGLLASCIADEH